MTMGCTKLHSTKIGIQVACRWPRHEIQEDTVFLVSFNRHHRWNSKMERCALSTQNYVKLKAKMKQIGPVDCAVLPLPDCISERWRDGQMDGYMDNEQCNSSRSAASSRAY